MTHSARIIAFPAPRPVALEDLEDGELLAQCARRSPAALGPLYTRHAPTVLRFLARTSGLTGTEAEDAVQEVFLIVYQNADRFEGHSAPRSWILGIAANLARTTARKRNRRLAMQSRNAESFEPLGQPDIEERAISRDLLERVADCLDELPHELREVFVLCDLESVPGVDVARSLGLPTGTLYRRLHDARRLLRAALQGGEA
jgi:RNA polymerase sigma-70 factor (ECF subfamily)